MVACQKSFKPIIIINCFLFCLFFFAEKDIEMLRDINSLVEEEVCNAIEINLALKGKILGTTPLRVFQGQFATLVGELLPDCL